MKELPYNKPYRLENVDRVKSPPDRGIWYAPKDKGCVSSTIPAKMPISGSEEVKYYNGYLICESVAKKEAVLISHTPEMERLLYELIQIDAVQHFGKIREIQEKATELFLNIQYRTIL